MQTRCRTWTYVTVSRAQYTPYHDVAHGSLRGLPTPVHFTLHCDGPLVRLYSDTSAARWAAGMAPSATRASKAKAKTTTGHPADVEDAKQHHLASAIRGKAGVAGTQENGSYATLLNAVHC